MDREQWIWANGDHYQGEFRNGGVNGQGTRVWSDGGRFEGAWLNGDAHGQGTKVFSSGERQVGYFQHGLMQNGTAYSLDGYTCHVSGGQLVKGSCHKVR